MEGFMSSVASMELLTVQVYGRDTQIHEKMPPNRVQDRVKHIHVIEACIALGMRPKSL